MTTQPVIVRKPFPIRKVLSLIPLYLVAILGAFLTLVPFAWMVLSSFKTNAEIFSYPPAILPKSFTISNFVKLFEMWTFGTWYINSILVAMIGTIAVLFFSSLAGFGFAKYNFKGRNVLFGILIASTMISFPACLDPAFHRSQPHENDQFLRRIDLTFHGSCFRHFLDEAVYRFYTRRAA